MRSSREQSNKSPSDDKRSYIRGSFDISNSGRASLSGRPSDLRASGENLPPLPSFKTSAKDMHHTNEHLPSYIRNSGKQGINSKEKKSKNDAETYSLIAKERIQDFPFKYSTTQYLKSNIIPLFGPIILRNRERMRFGPLHNCSQTILVEKGILTFSRKLWNGLFTFSCNLKDIESFQVVKINPSQNACAEHLGLFNIYIFGKGISSTGLSLLENCTRDTSYEVITQLTSRRGVKPNKLSGEEEISLVSDENELRCVITDYSLKIYYGEIEKIAFLDTISDSLSHSGGKIKIVLNGGRLFHCIVCDEAKANELITVINSRKALLVN